MIVVWRVVDSCNLACPFCAFDKRLSFPRKAADPQEVLRFAQVLAAYGKQTGDPVLLSWLGGEPLRWNPIEELTDAVRKLGVAVSATTNGSSLGSSGLRRHLCAAYQELTISIDGFADFHDRMRGWPGAFEKLRFWVSALAGEAQRSGSALRLKANVVLMHQNLADFAALCLEIADWGIREITFNQLGGRDRPEFYPEHRLTRADVDALELMLPKLRRDLLVRGVRLVGGAEYLIRIRASALNECIRVDDCGPGESFLFIDEAGRISPCSFTSLDYGIDIRSLKSAADLMALPARFQALRVAKRSSSCDDCMSTQVCGKFERNGPAVSARTMRGLHAPLSA